MCYNNIGDNNKFFETARVIKREVCHEVDSDRFLSGFLGGMYMGNNSIRPATETSEGIPGRGFDYIGL